MSDTPNPTPPDIARNLRELAEFLTEVSGQSTTPGGSPLVGDDGRAETGESPLVRHGDPGVSSGGQVDSGTLDGGVLFWTRALLALVPESQRVAMSQALNRGDRSAGRAGFVPEPGLPGTADGLMNGSGNHENRAGPTTATTPAGILPLG